MRRNEQGVRFWDAAEWFAHVERAHGVHVHLTVCTPVNGLRDKCLVMRLAAVRKGVGADKYFERGVSCSWPWSEAQTMAGAWLKLAIQLDELLTEEEARGAKRLSQLELF